MKIEENISLKPYNTFGIDAKALYFASIYTEDELLEALSYFKKQPVFVLGGGSNMLLTKDITIPVIHLNLKGIEVVEEHTDFTYVKVQAGENWHQFVLWCLENNYGGVENLSLIPGNVGTSPIQNIGAYGVELKDVMHQCEAVSVHTFQKTTFTNKACKFGYRESVFKTTEKGNYIITSVTFKLTRQNHILHTGYGDIQRQLAENNITKPTIQEVSRAIIAIRQAKLPDPKELGNSGSFFKNPVINKEQFANFHSNNPTAPYYTASEDTFKVPAGWLIEQCGFKGKRIGDAGVHKNQALVLVNYGNATGTQIWELAKSIQQTVLQTFNIQLEAEVNIV